MGMHGITVRVIERRWDARATKWAAKCGCKTTWEGPTYEAVEDEWRKHVYDATGFAPTPVGEKEGRWTP